jgi:hypothetical protein
MKSLEVTLNLNSTADGVASVCQERFLKTWPMSAKNPTARVALWVSRTFYKAWIMPVLILRRASRRGVQERFKEPGLCQCQSYGARRVIVSPLAIEAQNSIFFFF